MIPSASPTRLLLLGGLAVVFGVIATVWPVSTVLSLVLIWGFYALVDGIVMLADAVRGRARSRGWSITMGIIGILAGLIAIFQPFTSALALTWVLGVWLVASGITHVIDAFQHPTAKSRWLAVLAGVAYIVAGLLIMANSAAAALTISIWLGLLAILWGILLLGSGIALRSSVKTTR